MFLSLILTEVAYCFPLLEENGSPQGVSFALFETDRYGHKEKKHSSIAVPKFSSLSILSMEKGISECFKKTSEKPVILSATCIFKKKGIGKFNPLPQLEGSTGDPTRTHQYSREQTTAINLLYKAPFLHITQSAPLFSQSGFCSSYRANKWTYVQHMTKASWKSTGIPQLALVSIYTATCSLKGSAPNAHLFNDQQYHMHSGYSTDKIFTLLNKTSLLLLLVNLSSAFIWQNSN